MVKDDVNDMNDTSSYHSVIQSKLFLGSRTLEEMDIRVFHNAQKSKDLRDWLAKYVLLLLILPIILACKPSPAQRPCALSNAGTLDFAKGFNSWCR